ncbi:Bacterial alpha-L-rhamnosidase [Inquilinus sp. KBS0705]|nr:Bacterial alpha-L-rhamnosidase [Inquilinus sp. KBS0705]
MAVTGVSAQVSVKQTSVDEQANPVGIDNVQPVFAWQLSAVKRNVRQQAYRILVADDPLLLSKNEGNIWDSKKVLSGASIQVPYKGVKLSSAKSYYYKVKVWDNDGRASAWSKPAKWQMGLLSPADWKGAQWIAYNRMPDSLYLVPALENPADERWNKGKDILPLLRKEFVLNKAVKKATIFITGMGQFDLRLNGAKVGDHFLDPGWTKYDKHAQYVTFDITDSLKKGRNALGVMLGNGFYYIPGDRYHKLKGAYGYPKMICRVLLQYADGTQQNIISDNSWKATPGPVTYSSIYGGEDYDATLYRQGWDKPGFDDHNWQKAITVDGPPVLEAQTQYPLKTFDDFAAVKVSQPKPGVWVYDMGQNASAIPYIALKGKSGATVKITPAELLDNNGLVLQAPVGQPVYFNYTLNGAGTQHWSPQFMYYGFRYIQVEGAVPTQQPNPDLLPVITDIKSLHTRNSAPAIGSFKCSNDLFNRTFKLIDWAIQSNTASIFTDCPHREKLGWLEEAHLVGSSIRYNYDIATLCRKVVKDMMVAQTPDGLIPDIAPEYVQFQSGFRDSPEWGSNGIIMPWYLYQWYGDKQILAQSYDMMTRYVAYLEKRGDKHILNFGLGDWYDIGPKDPGESQLTPKGLTATAIYYYDLTLLTKIAGILGKADDSQKYAALAAEVKQAFNNKFYNSQTNQYGSGSQTANAMAVYMGLVSGGDKPKVVDNIIKDIRLHNNGITAGDIGYRYLLRVLDDAGRSDVIFDMNSRSDVPGYGYQLAQGATALTESWQGNRISSNNHFMLGHLMEWFYSGLGGIRPGADGLAFKSIIIRPEVVGDVKYASVSHRSPYGIISNSWEKAGTGFSMHTVIPDNTTAVIYLPANKQSRITEGGKTLSNRTGLKVLGYENDKLLIQAGSGSYSFVVK